MTQPAMQTMCGALRTIKPDLPQPQRCVPFGSTGELRESMIKGSAPIQMMKKGLGEELWREKEKLALEETLPTPKGALTSDAWLEGIIAAKKSRYVPGCLLMSSI